MVREGEGLLALRGVRRVSEIEPHRRRGLGRARKAVVSKRGRKAGERGERHAMCESGERRGTREVLGRIERHTFSAQRKQGSGPATVGIIAVCIPRGHLVETLGEEVAQGGGDRRRMPLVPHGSGEAFCHAALTVDPPQQEGAKVGPDSVSPEMGGKRRCSGVACGRSTPLGVFTA